MFEKSVEELTELGAQITTAEIAAAARALA